MYAHGKMKNYIIVWFNFNDEYIYNLNLHIAESESQEDHTLQDKIIHWN